MALDPIYISMHAVRDFTTFGGEARLDLADQVAIRSARNSTRVDYASVRRVKEHALRMAFESLLGHRVGARHRTRRIVRGVLLVGRVGGWPDYALYRALRERSGGKSWTEWDEPFLRRRDPAVLADAARWSSTPTSSPTSTRSGSPTTSGRMRVNAAAPVALFGDFPFMVSTR